MPFPSPFHDRTAPLVESHEWRNWSGYLSPSLYEHTHDHEYYAIRSAAALIDVSPLYKYEISGPDAARLVNRIITRDIEKCAVGQVLYTPWCDDDGKLIDDGTVARLEAQRLRVTAAEPNLAWFQDCAFGLDVQVRDVSQELASLALQGPHSRRILQKVFPSAGLEGLKYYRLAQAILGGVPLTVTRTGYTGDLGYELWVAPGHAGLLWDRLMEAGQAYGLAPAGILALDIARIEAGLIMLGVDYISARKALIAAQKSSPFDMGLGWAVDLNKPAFIGKPALVEEKRRGSPWEFVGLEVRWESLEEVFGSQGLAPQVAGRASRLAAPIYKQGKHIGQATSHTFSPLLKRYIAIGTLEAEQAQVGSPVRFEVTVEHVRRDAEAVIVKPPFFNPPRKRL